MVYQRKKRKLTAEINVVPYIDVMLVLLIIFMVTAPFITQGVDVNLPQTTSATSVQKMVADKSKDIPLIPIIVEVTQDAQFGLSVNNEDMQRNLTLAEVINKIQIERDLNPNSPVFIGGDKTTPYGDIVTTLDALNKLDY